MNRFDSFFFITVGVRFGNELRRKSIVEGLVEMTLRYINEIFFLLSNHYLLLKK